MRKITEIKASIESGALDGTFARLYPNQKPEAARERYLKAINSFKEIYGLEEAALVSAPGRTELGGNHTDHQHGCVLAASVDLDLIAVVAPNNENCIKIKSEGYPEDIISLDNLAVHDSDKEHAASLIRGVADWFVSNGHPVTGFSAYTTSNVLSGSGLSSSAAFEVAVGNMINAVTGSGVSAIDIAIAGKYAENVHFGKPSGLMDQMASSVGNMVSIDFKDPKNPLITKVDFDFEKSGYILCIVDTRASHGDITYEYSSIADEMKAVSNFFGKDVLRDVDESEFLKRIASIRSATGDRAVLRAMHFFADNARAVKMAEEVEQNNFTAFLKLVTESGVSSLSCLQNIYSTANVRQQGLSIALALSGDYLKEKGAYRVHGGGFAGTIQAYVPRDMLNGYVEIMENVFGAGAVYTLSIRPDGGIVIPV